MIKSNRLVPYRDGDRWGFSNVEGECFIPCVYEYVFPFSGQLATVQSGSFWGAINPLGQLIIPCIYERPLVFSEGLAVAKKPGGKIGFVDTDGKSLTNYVMDKAKPFESNLAIVTIDGLTGAIDHSAEMIIPLEFEELLPFSDNVFRFKEQGKWGLLDYSGKKIIPAKYIYIHDAREGIAQVESEEEVLEAYFTGDAEDDETDIEEYVTTRSVYGYIDQNGKEVVECRYENSCGFKEGIGALLTYESGELGWFFVSRSGHRLIERFLDDIEPFSGGVAIVKCISWGIIDKIGRWIVEPKFDKITDFSEGVCMCARISEDSSVLRWTCVDKTGSEIFSVLNYSSVGPFKEGLARVKKGDRYGFIDMQGSEIIPCVYESAGNFDQGLVRVKNGKWGIIDRYENVIVSFKYDIIGDFKEGLAEIRDGSAWAGREYDSDEFIHPGFYQTKYLNDEYEGQEIPYQPLLGYIDRFGQEYFRGEYSKVFY